MATLLISSFRALRTVSLADIAHELHMDPRHARAMMRRSLWYHGKRARHVYLFEDKPAIIEYLSGFSPDADVKSVHIRQCTEHTGDDR